MNRQVVVIGGGIAGLATGGLLARDGDTVTVLEQNSRVGGRAGTWASGGFRFETGPSWYLMPEVFDHYFRLMGTSAAEQLDLVTLDPGYRVFFEGESRALEVHADREQNIREFEAVEPGAGAKLNRYLASARDTYRIAVDRFLYSTFESFRPLLTRDVLLRTPRLAQLLLQSLDSFTRARFRDPRLRQVLGYPAVFLGSSPFDAPSLYHLMSHLDLEDGVLYPRGGFTAVIDAIAGVAEGAGASVVTGARVLEIQTERGSDPAPGSARGRRSRVLGVRYLDQTGTEHTLPADVVVSAADLHHTETCLISEPADRSYPENWWQKRIAGPGAVLVLLGVRGELPQLAHHSLFFTSDWRTNFGDIFGTPSRVPDPASLYVCRPSATDPAVAPAGHENLFVLVPMPADVTIGSGGVDGAGDAQVEQIADRAIAQIASEAGIPDLAERIVVRRTIGPADFAQDFNSWQGSALGPAHTLRQSAFFRGKNVSSRVGGLLYAGATTVPGIGLPMCLISAELVLKRLRGDRSGGPMDERRAFAGAAAGAATATATATGAGSGPGSDSDSDSDSGPGSGPGSGSGPGPGPKR